jgi:hypothetical protein
MIESTPPASPQRGPAAGPFLQKVDGQKQGERKRQHHRRHGRGSGLVVLFQLAYDDQGHDFGFLGHVAGNENDGSVFSQSLVLQLCQG